MSSWSEPCKSCAFSATECVSFIVAAIGNYGTHINQVCGEMSLLRVSSCQIPWSSLIYFVFKFSDLFSSMSVCLHSYTQKCKYFLDMYMPCVWAVPLEARRGARYCGTGVVGVWEPSCGCWGLNLGPGQVQPGLLTEWLVSLDPIYSPSNSPRQHYIFICLLVSHLTLHVSSMDRTLGFDTL